MINDISVKISSKLLITKITRSFDKSFDQLSINNSFEAERFEPDTTFEKTTNDIKSTHFKSIASAATNPSDITSSDKNFDTLCIKNSFEAEKFEPEPTFEKTINEIKYNHLKSIYYAATSPSAIVSFDKFFDPLFLNNSF